VHAIAQTATYVGTSAFQKANEMSGGSLGDAAAKASLAAASTFNSVWGYGSYILGYP